MKTVYVLSYQMIEDLDSLDCSEEKEDTTCMTVPYVKVYKLMVRSYPIQI